MAHGLRHPRSNRTARSASQGTTTSGACASNGAATPSDASQRTRHATPPQQEPTKKRGRKLGSLTKLKLPQRGAKVALKPCGDMQFTYVNFKPVYRYPSQLGAIIKREYPGLVEDKDDDGVGCGLRPALVWPDYFLNTEMELTSAECVLSEFWHLFEVAAEDKDEADRVLDNYLKKRVRDVMYQARVDAVKVYYAKQDEQLDDDAACAIELQYDQYMDGQLSWCNDTVWPELCRYWCSDGFMVKRKRGQDARMSSEDTAQNHGGSRPFAETQQVLEVRYGQEKATPINTYAVMKCGIHAVDSAGNFGPIRSRKAQKRIDDYIAGSRRAARPQEEGEGHEDMEEGEGHEDMEEGEGHEDMEEEEQAEEQGHENQQQLNGQVLYDVSASLRSHGHLAIGHGAVRAADVRAAAKGRSVRSSNAMTSENTHLRRANSRLEQDNHRKDQALEVTTELLLGLYRDLGKEIPQHVLRRLSAAGQAIATGSSHVGPGSTNNSIDGDGHGGEDGEELGGSGTRVDDDIHANNCHTSNNASV